MSWGVVVGLNDFPVGRIQLNENLILRSTGYSTKLISYVRGLGRSMHLQLQLRQPAEDKA